MADFIFLKSIYISELRSYFFIKFIFKVHIACFIQNDEFNILSNLLLLFLQTALDEERRAVQEQLSHERNQMATAREEMLTEQRRIIAECYEEKRKLADERNQLSTMQRDIYDRNTGRHYLYHELGVSIIL